jgi:hypothetical protein
MHRPTLCTLEASCFLRACHLEGRHIRRSEQGSRYVELEGAYKCQQYSEFSQIGWILLKVY